jgi:hypothetical protein
MTAPGLGHSGVRSRCHLPLERQARVAVGAHPINGRSPVPPPDQRFPKASIMLLALHNATGVILEVPGHSVRLSARGLRRNRHGCVNQIHHEELKDGEKERSSGFPKIML